MSISEMIILGGSIFLFVFSLVLFLIIKKNRDSTEDFPFVEFDPLLDHESSLEIGCKGYTIENHHYDSPK